jgi:protein pelota
MKILGFNQISNAMRLEPESFDDLYLLAVVINAGDTVEGKSTRRFRPSEGDKGEQKDVVIKIIVEKAEIDRSAFRLRVSGKIIEGRPLEFVSLGSYHTLNIETRESISVHKDEWKAYIMRRLKEAVADSKKPKLGIVAMDEEKVSFAYIKGYGIDIFSEIYSKLSKKMNEKEYKKQKEAFFDSVISAMNNMPVDVIVIGGPGFTKDDLKKYMDGLRKKVEKRLAYVQASDAERSGIREIMQSEAVAKLLENERVKKEFFYLNMFLSGLVSGKAAYGAENVKERLDDIKLIMVNDDVLNDESVKKVLDMADSNGIKIEIFNSGDDAGMQLVRFRGIAAI